MTSADDPAFLRAEIQGLRTRLEEAENLLQAIRQGEVDAFVVDTEGGPQLYALQSAEATSNQLRGEMLAHVSDAVLSFDKHRRITYLNAAAERQYGVAACHALGQPLETLFTSIWPHPEAQAEADRILREQGRWRGECVHVTQDGRRIDVESSVTELHHVDGEAQGVLAVIRDISTRREGERALRESEERFRTLADNMSQLAWMADAEGKLFWYNQRWYDYTGADAAQMEHGGWKSLHHPDHKERVVKGIESSWQTGEPWEDLFPIRAKDGHYRWFLSHALPILDDSGNVVRWFGTHTDVTEQRAAEEALKRADRRKDEFLAVLAHELRNPLATIRSGLEILRIASHDAAMVERVRGPMERQTHQLVTLIDDLLDVSRITRGKLELRRARVKLQDALESAVEASRSCIDENHHQLILNLPSDPVYLNADPNRLAQVISNLLNNAAQYTPENGRITLSAQPRDGRVAILVTDNGVGIPPDMQDRIFEMFAQVDRPPEKGYSGLGIGLTLVKSLVEMHGGRISVRSEGFGHGSEFSVELPIFTGREAEPEPEIPAVEEVPRSNVSSRRVLVVDDNIAAADLLSMAVMMLGHDTRTAHDGEEAIVAAEEFQPDVVLMDLGMPRMNGYEAARRLREHPWGRRLLLVALTGWGQDEDKRRTREAGFDEHLVKPVEPSVLQRMIAELGA